MTFTCEELKNWVECSMYNSEVMSQEECEAMPIKVLPSELLNPIGDEFPCLIESDDCSYKFIFNTITNTVRTQTTKTCTGNIPAIVAIVASTVLLMWIILLLALELPKRFPSLPRQGTVHSRTS